MSKLLGAASSLILIAASEPQAADYASDAKALVPLIAANYAYLDHLPGRVVPTSARLDAERDAVRDKDSLLHYAEDVLTTLADHHATTGKSFKDDWALVPSYSDLWIVRTGDAYRIDAVRAGSSAAAVGIHAGDRLVAIDGQPIDGAVAAFWARLGLKPDGERPAYAARPVTVRVGRWTGSMGEGLAAGFAAIGARVCGTPMAGLKGAVYDFDLPKTGLRVRFPAERLTTVAGLPREQIVPRPC